MYDVSPRATSMSPDERRKAIVTALVPLLVERGGEVTTREIAQAAGIAEGTIFRVFPDKKSLLLAAAGWFTPSAMLLLALYSGLMKLVAVVFEGRLQHAIASDRRATIGSVKSFLAQISTTVLYMGFGPVAQATSYRIAFMACGVTGLAIGLAYLSLPGRRRAYASPKPPGSGLA